MNYRDQLMQGQSRALTTAIYKHVGDDKTKFKELAQLVFGDDKTLQQRAAWPFSEIILSHHSWITPYWQKTISMLQDNTVHEAVHRNLLRCLQEITIPERYQGPVLDSCLAAIKSEQKAIAVRAFSITVAQQICKRDPDLSRELLLVLQELQQHALQPALTVRLKRALKTLNKNGLPT